MGSSILAAKRDCRSSWRQGLVTVITHLFQMTQIKQARTSRFMVMTMTLQVSSSTPYLMPLLQQNTTQSSTFATIRFTPLVFSPCRIIWAALASLSTCTISSENLRVSALTRADISVEKGREKAYLRLLEMMVGWKLQYYYASMVFLVLVDSAWLLLVSAISDWFWYLWCFFIQIGFMPFQIIQARQREKVGLGGWQKRKDHLAGGMTIYRFDLYYRQNSMQISDIVSPTYSVNSNAFKLNSSSVAASTPGCDPQARHVEFQEFTEHNFHLPARVTKKRLTIDIDEINDFQQNVQKVEVEEIAEESSKSSEEEMRVSHMKNERAGENQLYLQEKIKSLTSRVKELERGQEEMMKENQRVNHLLLKKEEALELKQRLLEDLTLKLAEVESQTIQDKFYDQKLREKQSKYRELQKIHEKVVAMNRTLQRDLRESEKKIMELQKEIQKSVCATQYENMLKVKESSIKLKESSLKVFNAVREGKENKENALTNTVKSLDKKKPTTQPKKSSRIISSTINFAKKLQVKGSVI